MYITGDPRLAKYAAQSGVSRIFVDLEIIGKHERQGHKDTLISNHTIQNLREIRKIVPGANILVRINPFYEDTRKEIEEVLKYNPQMIMLPMYTTVEEVQKTAEIINGRCDLIPLLETKKALECVEDVCSIPGVSELYVGLNDLHLSLGMDFMFEPLANGMVEQIANIVHNSGKKFGFGGVARLGEGLLKSEYILSEHLRLKSNSVILSRTFHRQLESVNELENKIDFHNEIEKIKAFIDELEKKPSSYLQNNKIKLQQIIGDIIKNIKNKGV